MIQLFEYHKQKKRQKDVDFLIPFLDVDRRYCLDPALLRYSKTKSLQGWNEEIKEFLKLIRGVMKQGDNDKLRSLLNIGEAPDAGLGYCNDGVLGSGVGDEISKQVIEILSKNESFKQRGFINLEELQWLDKDIGPDRISDLAINILKRHLIKYTKAQAKKHKVPTEVVRVNKVFEPNSLEWISVKEKLPVNPMRRVRDALNPNPPLLFIPKEIVKTLPLFLNYDDFYGFVDKDYVPGVSRRKPKISVVESVIDDPELSTEYLKFKETEKEKLYRPDFDTDVQQHIAKLDEIPSGSKKHADQYMDTVKVLIDFIFKDLSFYQKEKRTILGEARRDLIYQNNAVSGIFSDLKIKHAANHIVIDTKNTNNVTAKDVAQVSNYLNDDIGRVAFIISRKKDKRLRAHSYTQLTKQKKVILFIADEDLKRWITDQTRIQHITGKSHKIIDPVKSISNMYSDIVSD